MNEDFNLVSMEKNPIFNYEIIFKFQAKFGTPTLLPRALFIDLEMDQIMCLPTHGPNPKSTALFFFKYMAVRDWAKSASHLLKNSSNAARRKQQNEIGSSTLQKHPMHLTGPKTTKILLLSSITSNL
ncbi:unnamed protein product [Trifolium pratense]|uniref:Uncharacterized protein n=1 Tax=Trifolium pratense TaxID=57577 RepID=A0ACB0IT97_TRIPR|nr:unnamed protein product [Trifolium pratense]